LHTLSTHGEDSHFGVVTHAFALMKHIIHSEHSAHTHSNFFLHALSIHTHHLCWDQSELNM